MEFEIKIIEFLQAGTNDFWNMFFRTVSIFGSYVFVVCLLLAVLFIDRKKFVLFGGTLGIGFLLVLALKFIIKRNRPFVDNPQIMQLDFVTGFSFPSLHAVCVTISAILLCYLVFCVTKKKMIRTLTIIASILFVMLVCLSRMYLGVHYLTDVCAGIICGCVISVIMLLCYKCFLEKWLSKIIFLNNKKGKK